jgi:hypothetical protein
MNKEMASDDCAVGTIKLARGELWYRNRNGQRWTGFITEDVWRVRDDRSDDAVS